jgi:signal transduction histidine kinase/PAS domain-containing protein
MTDPKESNDKLSPFTYEPQSGSGRFQPDTGAPDDNGIFHRTWLGYGVAVILVAAAVVVRMGLLGSLGARAPYVTFYPAVIIAALYGGLGAGLTAAILSAAASPIFWMDPNNRPFVVQNPEDWLALIAYLISCAMISWVCEAMHRTKMRAAKAENRARITEERKRSEAALRESEMRFRLALLNKPLMVYQQDRDLRYTWIYNPYPHLRSDAIVGKTDEELFPPAFAAPLTALKRRVMETGIGAREEVNTPIGGVPCWWDLTVEPWRNMAGEIDGVSCAAMDVTIHKRVDDALRFLVQCGSSTSDEDFFKALAPYLARSLGMDYVGINQLQPDKLAVETLIIFYNGRFEKNINYALKDTPCGDVVGKAICCFPKGVRYLFPNDEILQEMLAESYIGTTLWSSQGQPIGLISIVGRQPLDDPQWATSMLQIVAVRAAAELERREADQALRRSEAALQRANENLQSINEQLLIGNETLEARVKERTADLEQRTAQLRALASELTQTEQRERQRLAKILHDHMQQLLVGAKFRIASLRRAQGENLNLAIADLDNILADCIEASRSLTAELSPPVLHDAGLVPALEWLGRWVKQKHQLMVLVDAREDINVAREDVRIMLFEAVRELLFNVVKHSGVLNATIRVMRQNGELHVIVADQGVGFDPAEVMVPTTSGSGFGLFSIRERLDLMGGRMEIESVCGKGSLFRLIVASD